MRKSSRVQPREALFASPSTLMRFRVREVLLVSSMYDAFSLEEDGHIGDQLFMEYSELNLSSTPRITHAPSAARARELLQTQRFDLVISMLRLGDADVVRFGEELKEIDPELSVVVLAASAAELRLVGNLNSRNVDGVFVWTGDAAILLAIIKQVEDARNMEEDTKAGVRVILFVEDSVRRYSSFLSLLYAELMEQSQSLVAEGVNELHKLGRMRARPKVLHVTTLEDAVERMERYADNLFALITDGSFLCGGKENPEAGFELMGRLKALRPDVPVLLQSADADTLKRGEALANLTLNKNDPRLLHKVRSFVTEALGFGDFIFRMEDGEEVGRSADLFEMEARLQTVPGESLAYHAAHQHFSQWFMARTLFAIGREVQQLHAEDIGGVEALRERLIEILRHNREESQSAMITDFSERPLRTDGPFLRIGKGSMGGKARGLAFLNLLLAKNPVKIPGMEICTPKTIAIATSEYDAFIEDNRLNEKLNDSHSDEEVLNAFLAGRLHKRLRRHLRIALGRLQGPIVVRSSSLLEDAQFQPFAGVYSTYILPNHDANAILRFEQLCDAVKAVYASAYMSNARAYMERTSYSIEDEKMGVVLQELVGQEHNGRFYPLLSGVGLSNNYYPLGSQRSEDGVVMLAMGLGQQVAAGGRSVQFCPSSPGRLPQYYDVEQLLEHSQKAFYALDLTQKEVDFRKGPESTLGLYDLKDAEADDTLQWVASVYDPIDGVIRDNLRLKGPRVLSFRNILKWEDIPVAPALVELLDVARFGMGCPVELEFCVDVRLGQVPTLYVLQIRPQVVQMSRDRIELDAFGDDEILMRTADALGHGVVRGLSDVIYVKNSRLGRKLSPIIADEVGQLNREITQEGRSYALIGPGRWGSSDPVLGIPVNWSQIGGARVIVETPVQDRPVEPSQGSHFFHNITSLQIAYLTLGPESHFDRAWLDALPSIHETENLRHVRLEQPMTVCVDALKSSAVILKYELGEAS